ncbi:response regulator transcription factor [Nocardia amamiensis]|uniref:Response regulator transcription factor n=1 Tax=Nocardia amamiensis TaxID=404578 RepID=A0ABS0D2M4_9NOCA|nr:response regulator transcription factor [Nocardia amamiensis]
MARKVLGGAAYTAAEQRGARLSPVRNEVHRLALGELVMDSAPPPVPETPLYTLSTPQLEIAILVAAGYTNRAIAERRGVSRRTIDAQVAAIFSKLGISSRKEVRAKIPANLMPEVDAAAGKRPQTPNQNHRQSEASP